ncbi:MAG TPA: hypothetical protein VL326_35300 [Kofleriaceae bacterium]|nr:hypothetical protein [Kofleriaceae bacterium]
MATTNASSDPMRAVAWALVLGSLVIGWFFIVWQNKFHMTAPTVMLCLGYLAVVATIANLWRVGAAAVAPEDASAEAWSRPIGERDELEKEKKTLLKAIKEAEFDYAMGKLSKADSDQLIASYRTRAIAVIKELERLDGIAAAQDTRGQIEREVAARLALEGGKKKKDKAAKKAAAKEAAAKEEAAKAAKDAKAGKFATPPKAKAADADADDDSDDEDEDRDDDDEVAKADAKADAEPKEKTRPSQRSFSTSNEGDSTPLPPPTAEADEDSKPGDSKPGDAVKADADDAKAASADAKAEKPATFAEPPKADAKKEASS